MYVDIKNIKYNIDHRDILKDISISVKKGQFVGIIGPNGSGKSTFLKNIYKVIKPDQGCVYINDKDILKLSNREFANEVAVVAQESSVTFDFTVKDVILMGRYSKKKLFDRVDKNDLDLVAKTLRTVNMDGFEERKFSKLSGGEKQRILIARSLVQETEVLILDEPTNHLDIGSQIKTLNLLKQSKKTILTALHDLNIASKYCDVIFVIDNGQILKHGKPKDIIDRDLIKKLYKIDSEVISRKDSIIINYL